MKVVKIIRNIIVGLLVTVFFAFTVAVTILLLNGNKFGVPQLGSSSVIVINDTISSENYKKGDLVIVKTTKIENVAKGDELFVYKLNKGGDVSIDLGTIGEVHKEDDAISFENGSTYAMEFVAGKADKVYNDIGAILSLIISKWGFLFIILVPNFLIFIYVLSALISEIKYGKVEN